MNHGRNVIGTILSNVRNRLRPAGGPQLSINASPVAVAAKKMDEYEGTAPSVREMAAEIAPTVIPPSILDNKEKENTEINLDLSKDSIDLGGSMLKMLHERLGVKSTKSNAVSLNELPTKLTKISENDVSKNKTDTSVTTELTEEDNESGKNQDEPEKTSNSSSSLEDLDESTTATIDSISVRSDHTADIANLTLSDGKLDKEKVTNLPFPQMNISRSLEKSFMDLQNKSRVSSRATKIIGNEEQSQPSRCSTPVSTVTSRKQPRRSKRHLDEKEKMNALLKDLDL